MAGGGGEFEEGAEALGMDVASFRVGGSRPPDFWKVLKVSGKSDTPVCCRIMGDVPSYWEDPGQFSPQGGPSVGKDASKEGHDEQVYLSSAGRGNEFSGIGGGGDVRPPSP